ncbi:MAG: hypothetical protein IJ423_03560 [Clostridia bacterium]|nr:hypothetical protein [Clostridia bacterium]
MTKTVLISLINIVFWLVVFYGTAGIIVALPNKWQKKLFDSERRFYTVSEREMNFYRQIRLPKWKDKLPQHNADFEKRHLPKEITKDYLLKYIFVTCRAEIIHYVTGIVGYLSLFFSFLSENVEYWYDVYMTIATAMMIGNIPFSMIQRYNRYRLKRLLKSMEHKRKFSYSE